jgi:hypothetical protein
LLSQPWLWLPPSRPPLRPSSLPRTPSRGSECPRPLLQVGRSSRKERVRQRQRRISRWRVTVLTKRAYLQTLRRVPLPRLPGPPPRLHRQQHWQALLRCATCSVWQGQAHGEGQRLWSASKWPEAWRRAWGRQPPRAGFTYKVWMHALLALGLKCWPPARRRCVHACPWATCLQRQHASCGGCRKEFFFFWGDDDDL